MRGTVLFVHGAGVRGTGVDQTVEWVRNGFARNGIVRSNCGTCTPGRPGRHHRGRHRRDAAHAASGRAGLGADEVGAVDLEAARWSMLLDDPLLELRVVGGGAPRDPAIAEVTVGELRADQQARDMLVALSMVGPPLEPALDDSGLTEVIPRRGAPSRTTPSWRPRRGPYRRSDAELLDGGPRGGRDGAGRHRTDPLVRPARRG